MPKKPGKKIFEKGKIRNLFFAISGVLAALVIASLLIYLSRHYLIQQAESRIQDVMQEAESLHQYVQQDMHPAMYQLKQEGRMPANFYSPQILSSSYITRHVFQHFNESRAEKGLPFIEYKLAADNPRNSINLANDFENDLLKRFRQDTTLLKYSGLVESNDTQYLYYAKPFLKVEQRCLACHGSRESAPAELAEYYLWQSGFDWEVGTIPAVEIIKTPLVAEFDASEKIAIVILFFAIVILGLIVFSSRLSLMNATIQKQKRDVDEALSKLKRTQVQLVQSEKMASLGILTAGVAHEINNPLNYIMGGYKGIEKYFGGSQDIQQGQVPALLSCIKAGIDRATDIVKGLNQFSRDNEKKDERCNVHEILDNCLLMMHNELKHRIEIEKDYTRETLIVRGNGGHLHQIFINILTNAEQAIDGEGKICISTRKDIDICIEIADNGCGIEPDKLKNITDPFYTTKAPGEGTGLGLSIAYSLITEMGGTLTYQSELNHGTTAVIKLPTGGDTHV